ncbi:MAG TPA: ABC transporter ATP-binding protein [Acidimicrobiia bacterium]
MNESVPALEVRDLAVHFRGDGGTVHAVDGVSFAVGVGETVAVVGESGSGKTVTALAVMGLVDPPGLIETGTIELGGRGLVGLNERQYREVRGREIGMIFQDPMTALNPVLRVGAQIAEAIRVHDRKVSRGAARTRAVELLERVGLAPGKQRARDFPHSLSGGMRQRVMVAIAIANTPRLLIADEPTTALDVTTQAQILELLGELQQELGMALLLVTHDLGVVAGLADRVVVMYAGRVVEQGPVDRVFARPAHPYTRGLLASVPTRGTVGASLVPIPGAPPNPTAMPEGCAFHPRCPLAEDRCRDEVPPLRDIAAEQRVACVRAEHAIDWSPSS